MIFKQQLTDISTVLNNTGNTTKLLTSFNALDVAQQKVLLSSSLLTEKQKEQCFTMATLSAANTKYTAEQLAKATGISTETLATWGLIESTDSLTISELAEKAASDAQAKNVLDKIIAKNAEAVANGNVTASNTALAASEGSVTLATGAFTTAIKANIKAMWTWMTTTPTGWLTMLAAGIFAVVKAYDALTVSVKEQKEKMEDSLSAYNDAKNELSNITTELENQEQAMDDLLAKEKLTYAEQGQLEELQAITKELRIQKDLAEKEEGRTQKEVAKDASGLFNKQFGKYDISENAISEYQSNASITGNNAILTHDKNDISAMIAGYRQFNDLLDEAYGSENQEDIDHFKSLTEDLEDSIFDTAQELQEQQSNIADYYNTIKDIPYSDLTTEQKEIVDSYNAISNAIELIYKQLDPNTWKSMQIESVFDTEGIEKTKEELVEMVKAGEFDESTLQSYPKLSEALEQNKISVSELRNELEALAEAESNVQDSTLNNETGISPLSISQTITQLNTQLKPAFDSLQSAYQDIFDDDGKLQLNSIDILSTCDSIKSKLDEMAKLGLDIDYSSYEDFVKVLSNSESEANDVQNAFNNLATAIIDAGVSGLEDFNTLKAALEDLGVVNNEIIAFQELCQNIEALKEAGLDLVAVYQMEQDESEAVRNEAQSTIETFVNERVSAENAAQALAYLELCKHLVNNVRIETQEDVNRILSLAEAAGIGAEALAKLEYFKTALENETDVKTRQWIIKSINEYTKTLAAEVETVQIGVDFNPEVNSPKTSNSKSSSSKETIDTFDWIQQAIENVEKEIEELDEVVNSAYSTFSQKNNALAQEISKVSEEIDLQQQAYDEYMRKADSIGLSDHYKELVQSGTIGIEDIADENLRGMIDEYQKWYDKAIDASNTIKDLKTDMKDLYVSAYELQTDNLKDRLDSNSITEKQYLEGLKTAYEKFYADLEDFAQQYHEAVLDYLDKEKDYLNNVAGAASSLLDTEIDNIRDDADTQESSLKRQIDLLEAKKKPLQDELDALEDKARKEELIYNLQKAQYALVRAENQRTKLVNNMPDTIVI